MCCEVVWSVWLFVCWGEPRKNGWNDRDANVWDKLDEDSHQCSRIRIFRFLQFSKKHDFLRFFEMTYQKVVKSHQQKFSPQYVTKEWSLRSMITVMQFLAPKSHCWTFWLIGSIGRNKITTLNSPATDGSYPVCFPRPIQPDMSVT